MTASEANKQQYENWSSFFITERNKTQLTIELARRLCMREVTRSSYSQHLDGDWEITNDQEQGPGARNMVSANHWLRSKKTYTSLW